MRIHDEKFNLESEKVRRDYIFSLFSDVHITSTASLKLWPSLVDEVKKTSPDYIFVPGDIVYTSDDFLDSNNSKRVIDLFSTLNMVAPTFLSLGNHELKSGRRSTNDYSLQFLKSLEEKTGIKILDSRFKTQSVDLGDIRVWGFCPRVETYYRRNYDSWIDCFIEDYNNAQLEFPSDKYNILLTHSPDIISDPKVLRELREKLVNLDLILSGHRHDGYIPKWIQYLIFKDSDIGIDVSDGERKKDYIISIVDKCRGIHNVMDSNMIVTRGLRKYSHDNVIFGTLDKLSSKDISTIELKRTLKI
jgi:predicted MPP superfamily phosphohydrolase